MPSFYPPANVREEARRALDWRRTYKRGGTSVGLATARLLASGKPVSLKKARHIARYFPRHAVDARAKGYRSGERGFPSAGRIAWGLWGGTPGWVWSRKLVDTYRER